MAFVSGGGAVIDRSVAKDWAAWDTAPLSALHSRDRPERTQRSRNAVSPRTRRLLPRCPEIDCVRHLLPPGALALAELRAAETGVGADRVLIAQGLIDEETYLHALARSIGTGFEPLVDRPRDACPLTDGQLIEAANAGLMPLDLDGQRQLVIAPRALTIRRLLSGLRPGSDLARRVRLTSGARMMRFATEHARATIGYRAAYALRDATPQFSAGTGQRQATVTAVAVAAIAVFALFAPGAAGIAVEVMLGLMFLAWTLLRLLGMVSFQTVRRRPRPVPDGKLPVYTIVVALYREAAAAAHLVAALRRLNYPLEKLDIKLVLEPDDHETRARMELLELGAPFEIIVAPDIGPRTKPKALNAAMPFARGEFIAVYDAEDRPEPDQLRRALEAFDANDGRLACVQARLTIDNTSDSWLTRLFTAEYAGLFDVFLPGLAAWRLPLPLGGSSNHFRTEVLRRTGAWDAFNVTEDADLGMRIARLGYRTTVIPSTTYEEAPARLGPWLRQRTRWCKGWMQTWLVHMRRPLRLKSELGWVGFAVFQLLVGGTVLAALVHSLFVAHLALELSGALRSDDPLSLAALALHAVTLLAGYTVSIVIGGLGLYRRGLLHCGWALLLIPVYWVLLSIAAWRALIQLVRDPYLWEKTEHGLALSSRLAQRALRDSGAGPRRSPPAAA